MLRIISLFLLLIISRVSFAETISATSSSGYNFTFSFSGLTLGPTPSISAICTDYISTYNSLYNPSKIYELGGITSNGLGCIRNQMYTKTVDGVITSTGQVYSSTSVYPSKVATNYTCPSGYTQSDSAGNPDSSGQYCTKNSCQDLYQTTSMIPIPIGQTVTNACFDGCSATLFEGGSWVCPADSIIECSVRVSFDGNSCSGGVDYAANASSSDSGSDPDSPPPCSGGSTTGTVNGETVSTCADDGTDSPPVTDTPSSSTPTTTSGAGSTVGSPENTSGTQNSTVGGGADSLGGEGYGEGGSSGSSSGSDSGGTSSGSDSGSTSGSGTDSGGTSSGSDSGSTSGSGTDSGGTSSGGADSGSTSGGGTDSGGSSGSGSGSDTGTGTATSGAGDTDTDTPDTEEEEESGDGGGTFAAPGEGTDYLKDVFGQSDLDSLASDNAELTTKINQKMADVKAIFNLGTLSVSGDLPENQQEIKGASVDLSGRNIFEQLSIVAAAFYLCAIATAIYIVMGGRK